MKKVFICNDHVTGIFSAIYDAWKEERDEENAGIVLRGNLEQELFCEYVESKEYEKKAIAVERMIQRNLGMDAYLDIYQAVLAHDKDKGNAILGTLLAARKLGDSTKIMNHLSHPCVAKVFELSRRVGGEAHQFKGFLRFRELDNGVLFAEIEPKSQVLTCIAGHFSDRLPLENFMIYDRIHRMFIVHEARCRWVLVMDEEADMEKLNRVSKAQQEFERLWKEFCTSISIKERGNLKLQKQNLPLRYRQNIVEFS